MKLTFKIDDNYLVAHTLSNVHAGRFSSKVDGKELGDFQSRAWKQSKTCYELLVGWASPDSLALRNISALSTELPMFFSALKASEEYSPVRESTEEYLSVCEQQWHSNAERAESIIHEITGLDLARKFTAYITHPSLKNGMSLGGGKIAWGHSEDWPNYTTVYLWHEILHSYFETKELDHAIIQLIADEELRVRLNGGEYPPFTGHERLHPLMRKILPRWRTYLKSENKNIGSFKGKLMKSPRIPRS
ncbi:MAG: hypothetical protein V1934_00065 [Methanobacteriota archaeon]